VEHNFSATNAFAATDEPVNETQKGEIESFETTLVADPVESVPVLQGAVAIIVNLPTGCVANSSSNKGRLVLNNSTLEGIFRGTIKKWSEISDGGDTLTGTGCNTATAISPIVRFDGSGTTHIFKKYLGLISKSTFETEKGETKTWDDISEGSENTTWPKAAGVKKPGAKGGPEVLKLVAATPGSIAYANLADARANTSFVPPAGGPKKATFWAPLQNGATTYADPATNKDAAKLASANCSKTEYTNGKEEAFPPASVFETWNNVTTSTTEPKYTLCGLTYVTTLDSYGSFENGTGTSLGEATTVNNYLRFVTDTGKGGQGVIKNHDYLALNGTVLKEAQKGATDVGF
jgi:ABC-type phosphate transport system substrate-binding protein